MFEIPNMPLSGTFEEWDAWEDAAKRKHPLRWFFGRTVPLHFRRWWRDWIHEPWYWLKCRAWHRYNVVVCCDLPVTWNDRDDLLLHASFQILKDFAEKEGELGHHMSATREQIIEWYSMPELDNSHAVKRADDWAEVRSLYDWWEVRRKEDTPIGMDEEVAQADKDSEMLCRLAKVRGYLWT